MSKDQIKDVHSNISKLLSSEYEQAKDYKQEKGDWLSSVWSGFNSPSQTSRIRNTGVPIDFLKEVRCHCMTRVILPPHY